MTFHFDLKAELQLMHEGFDEPEKYPGEALEGVLYYLMDQIKSGDHSTIEGRADLKTMCSILTSLIDQREAMS